MSRKDDILDAALELAFEGGAGRVTTVAIAERLGLTQPALYRHFRSKAELWAALTDRLGDDVSSNIEQVRSGEGTAVQKLRALLLGHMDLIRRAPALPEIMIARGESGDDAVVRRVMHERMVAFHTYLTGLCREAIGDGALRRGIAAEDMAMLLFGVLQGLVLRLILTRDPDRALGDGVRLLDLQLSAFRGERGDTCETE